MAVARGAAAGLAGSAPRWFTESRRLRAVKPVLLADIGEGIVECEVIQWFVQPGARVEEFSPLCEVQSDKASVEITSRFTGTVKNLYYEAGDMAKVGKPFVDIDVAGEAAAEPGNEGDKEEGATAPTPRLAAAGRLSPGDMAGGTITVSNIGNIGGTYLSPVVVEREVAILGIGRMRVVPAFDDQDRVVRKHVCNFSWSADHRVVDGATMARAAEVVRRVVEEPDVMVLHLR
ncbi:Lipoamide Acyltransferase [Ophiocordyceps sinensis CO18]|uniref:Dihydrolipoamide acetyltransferase component of pyruvate dehydrogenase complex n=1 Tax=Ophiocordyceps sinensis (strain Co18 / CGMCC 3.14243) TaxID=911162 RepID=T5A780_OPHSC|nr:Lipoamide Acyltransferase [Ophiocordyceps sinensis CO18]